VYLFTLTVGEQIGEDLILDDADAYSLVDDRKRVSYISITQRRSMQIKGSRNVSHQRISPGNKTSSVFIDCSILLGWDLFYSSVETCSC
jgi:hypothetical protein